MFGNTDLNGDVIERGAFTKTLAETHALKACTHATFDFPLLWMHNEQAPIGGFDAVEDQKGLYIKGRVDLNIERGRLAFSGMQQGYMRHLSIGFDTVRSSRDTAGVRHLKEVRLWEGSCVTTGYAANPQAMVISTKQRQQAQRVRTNRVTVLAGRVEEAGAAFEATYARTLDAIARDVDADAAAAGDVDARARFYTRALQVPERSAAADAARLQAGWLAGLQARVAAGAATLTERRELLARVQHASGQKKEG